LNQGAIGGGSQVKSERVHRNKAKTVKVARPSKHNIEMLRERTRSQKKEGEATKPIEER